MLETLKSDKLVIVGVDMLLICVCRYVAWDCVPKYEGAVLATLNKDKLVIVGMFILLICVCNDDT